MTAESIATTGAGVGDRGQCEDYDIDDDTVSRCTQTGETVRIDGMLVTLCPGHLEDRQQRTRGRLQTVVDGLAQRLSNRITR